MTYIIFLYALTCCVEKFKGNTRATTLFPKRYLKIALLVEYNIYAQHFSKDMQKTLKQVQDLFHHVSLVNST